MASDSQFGEGRKNDGYRWKAIRETPLSEEKPVFVQKV